MTRFFYFFFLIVLIFISGMFGSSLLWALALIWLLILLAMVCLTWILQKEVQIHKTYTVSSFHKNEDLLLPFTISLKGKLPVFKLRVIFTTSFENKAQKKRRKIMIDPKTIHFSYLPEHCGKWNLQIKAIQVYDWIGLFYKTIRFPQWITSIAILPEEIPIPLKLTDALGKGTGAERNRTSSVQGENDLEIKDIKEYNGKQPLRHIHWNQTIRFEKIYVKEFEKESPGALSIFCDYGKRNTHSSLQISFYHQLVYSCLMTCLQKGHICQLGIQTKDSIFVCPVDSLMSLDKVFTDILLENMDSYSTCTEFPFDLKVTWENTIIDAQDQIYYIKESA